MENELIFDVALSFDESLTPIEKVALFEKYKSSRLILGLKKETLRTLLGRRWTGSRFKPLEFFNQSKRLMPFIEKAGIIALRYDSPKYPYGLKKIPDLPFLLYCRGNIEFDYNRSIAIVGTRKPDETGLERAKLFADYLALNGFTIISGLALGIDSAAHYHTLESSGKTIAVLGCGIDRIYPAANKALGRRILEQGGGIISEYPPEVIPKKWNFPRRNRIIVGMSRGVLIVQSPARSGSLISANLAADYNKELFVVSPEKKCGSLDQGNIDLIFGGAIEVAVPENMLNEWQI
jgi:DNA processing protein